jgi:hypothetical protein
MRLTVPLNSLVAHTAPAPNSTSHRLGPIGIRATTCFDCGFTRSTLPVPYPSIQRASAPIATPQGWAPTLIRAVTRFVAGSTRTTVASPKLLTQR